jgi:hypothetical protein
MEVIKGLFGKAQVTAGEVVNSKKKDDGYSRDVSTCPGMPTLIHARGIGLIDRVHCQIDKGDRTWYDRRA